MNNNDKIVWSNEPKWIDTLKNLPVGETWEFEGFDDNPVRVAASTLNQGGGHRYSVSKDNETLVVSVTNKATEK